MREQRRKFRRLSIWFALNSIIFVACYLNYRLQLKHRYLYKTLSVGLCLSRAAAMVINFNLLLVWLPMCKYTLTRLALLANGSSRQPTSRRRHYLMAVEQKQHQEDETLKLTSNRSKVALYMGKLKSCVANGIWKLQHWLYLAKLNSINSFLIAIDHCTSLHTICATTITIASVAHLMNVINFSKRFDPLLSNLNMADYKGQNPFQLLLSVPGITGLLMIIILLLMSLSSINIIRNSSFDLFQIFHRLSVIFVLLLILHPSSHILKEQSNVDRHHPELCYYRMVLSELNYTHSMASENLTIIREAASIIPSMRQSDNVIELSASLPPTWSRLIAPPSEHLLLEQQESVLHELRAEIVSTSNNQGQLSSSVIQNSTPNTRISNDLKTTQERMKAETIDSNKRSEQNETSRTLSLSNVVADSRKSVKNEEQQLKDMESILDRLCLDLRPLFVAQSSICWYVLSIGLSCYLLDMLFRRLRRSKSAIELLSVRTDREGNLIELILSNNHKRFAHWLPGQFVYLNCPQIAAFEWHPFTISSMDNVRRQFTLHIKTGGDWTRKLRKELETRHSESKNHGQNSMSLLNQLSCVGGAMNNNNNNNGLAKKGVYLDERLTVQPAPNAMASQQIECTKFVMAHDNELQSISGNISAKRADSSSSSSSHSVVTIDFDPPTSSTNSLNTINVNENKLDLFVDGPFHSPFERLLEQQVSVCIANGVGWTAFSSVYQCITNNFDQAIRNQNLKQDYWWSQWQNFVKDTKSQQTSVWDVAGEIKKLSSTRLHLMVIVTSIEQLRPFYYLTLRYFEKLRNEYYVGLDDELNQVRTVTAYLTRSNCNDEATKEFMLQENLSFVNDYGILKVNEVFSIYFGKPNFDMYLNILGSHYTNGKISVYCCGSYQVKKTVHQICQNLNKTNLDQQGRGSLQYSYHEENF